MKNKFLKLNLFLITIISALFVLPTYSNAADYSKGVSLIDSTPSGINTVDGGAVGVGIVTVHFKDNSNGYCVDPGLASPSNSITTCTYTDYTAEPAASQFKYVINNATNEKTRALAVRMIGIINGISKFKSDESQRNINCAYINFAAKIVESTGYSKTGIDSYNSTKSASGYKCTDTSNNLHSITDTEIEGLLKNALKQTASGDTTSGSHTVVKESGKVTINYKNMPEGSKISVECTGCSKTGDGNVKGNGNVVITNNTAAAGTCEPVSYKVTITQPGSDKCASIVKYSCGKASASLQSFYGCKNALGDGSENKTEESGTIDCTNKTCNKTPEIKDDNNSLCDSATSATVVKEASKYGEDVENCIIDGKDVNDKSLEAQVFTKSEYCKIFCTEDYYLNGNLMLSDKDAKNANGIYPITSGSYFNLKEPSIKGITNLKCYSKNDSSKLFEDVKKLADTYANKEDITYGTCDSETNLQVKTRKYYVVEADEATLKITLKQETQTESVTCSTSNVASSTGKYDLVGYTTAANDLIAKFENCNTWGNEVESVIKDKCNSPKVIFNYSDGTKLGITDGTTSKELEKESTVMSEHQTKSYKCTGNFGSGCSQATKNSGITIGDKKTNGFINSNYTESTATITDTYKMNSIGICNNYNTGESKYNVTETECKASEGSTYTTGWPVSFETTQGIYHYEINVTNYGYDLTNATCNPGRLDAVYDKLSDKEIFNETCEYGVNGCDDCDWDCDPDGNCTGDDDCDQECIWDCQEVGCMLDINNGLALDYKPISLINPNASIAYLSDQHKGVAALSKKPSQKVNVKKLAGGVIAAESGSASQNWSTEKGKAVLNEITTNGEKIYSKDPEYKIVLTPKIINKIRSYNKEHEEKGGYLDNSLKCKNYAASGSLNEYIVCESEFLKDFEVEGSDRNLADKFNAYTGTFEKKSQTGPAYR